MTAAGSTGDRRAEVAGDSFGPIIAGDHNTISYAVEDPRVVAARHVAAGIRHLGVGLHRDAVTEFRQARAGDPGNPEPYFLGAVANLDGKKAFLASLQCIRETEELILGALALEDRAVFHYLLAYIRYDYYTRKFLRPPAPWQESFDDAWNKGLTHGQIDALFTLLSVEDPLPAAR